MPSRLAAALLLLACGGGAWAQRGRNPRTPPDAMTTGAVQDLYRQARVAIQNLPNVVQPRLLMDVARDQLRQSPQQGLDGLEQAFNLALALPSTQEAEKVQVEREVVFELALRGEAPHALELTRRADVPKAPLYDALIEMAGRAEFDPANHARTLRQTGRQLAGTVMSMITECERSDGTFPYRGATVALRRESDALDRLELTRAAYTWAGNETDPAQIQSASVFLAVGHHLVPELDGILEDVLPSLISRVAASDLSGPLPLNKGLGDRLMNLLLRVDPARAEALAAQFPTVGAGAVNAFNLAGVSLADAQLQSLDGTSHPSPSPALSAGGGGAARTAMPLTFRLGRSGATATFSTTVTALADDSAADPAQPSGREAFLQLLARAEATWRHRPDDALALANQASGLLDQALWSGEPTAILRLATVYRELGDSGDANRLWSGCLQQADRLAAAADAAEIADPAQAATLVAGYGTPYAPVLEVYSLAARLDFSATAAHAEQAQFVLLKPAVLMRVALVGEVGRPSGR
ncbi:MAG: hypothetical protein ACRD2D_00780 [Terriglobales bacterium]